jgi:hypothetical protein
MARRKMKKPTYQVGFLKLQNRDDMNHIIHQLTLITASPSVPDQSPYCATADEALMYRRSKYRLSDAQGRPAPESRVAA